MMQDQARRDEDKEMRAIESEEEKNGDRSSVKSAFDGRPNERRRGKKERRSDRRSEQFERNRPSDMNVRWRC